MSDRACELIYDLFSEHTGDYVHYKHENDEMDGLHEKQKILYAKVKPALWVRLLEYLSWFVSYAGPPIIKPVVRLETEDSSRENNPNRITLVGHSAGGCTINALINLLYMNHLSLVRQGKMSQDTLPQIDDLDINDDETDSVFVDKYGEPLMVTPWSIRKVVYLSSPQGGVEFVRTASNMEKNGSFKPFRIGWFTTWVGMFYQRFAPISDGLFYDVYLEQFSNYPCNFPKGRDNIAYDFIEPNSKQTADRAHQILRAYGIETLTVITKASVPVLMGSKIVHLLAPLKSALLYPFLVFGSGYKLDGHLPNLPDRTGYTTEYYPNDGVVSVPSQKYGGPDCECGNDDFKDFFECTSCSRWYVPVDHLQIVGVFDVPRSVYKMYDRLFDWIEN
jgi:hypothetical protein